MGVGMSIRNLVDLGGYEGDCGEGKPRAVIVSDGGFYWVMVGNNAIARYDQQSDEQSYAAARSAADSFNDEL